MKPTKQLIRALRETAAQLRQNDFVYMWVDMDQCNCGLLAQNLLGIGPHELAKLRRVETAKMLAPWSVNTTPAICPKTGLPINLVLRTLVEAGIDLETDLFKIEFESSFEHNPKRVAAWMDREADKLEQQRNAFRRAAD